jgi:hypothetical protein
MEHLAIPLGLPNNRIGNLDDIIRCLPDESIALTVSYIVLPDIPDPATEPRSTVLPVHSSSVSISALHPYR